MSKTQNKNRRCVCTLRPLLHWLAAIPPPLLREVLLRHSELPRARVARLHRHRHRLHRVAPLELLTPKTRDAAAIAGMR